jgi:hypothetical protein
MLTSKVFSGLSFKNYKLQDLQSSNGLVLHTSSVTSFQHSNHELVITNNLKQFQFKIFHFPSILVTYL